MKLRITLLLLSAFFSLLSSVNAAVKPIGNPDAPKGGQFVVGLPSYPKHLLYYLAFDELSAGVNTLILEPLIDTDQETFEIFPALAESYTVSSDKKTFTFKINPKAKFSDGKPVTAEDVKFTWDTLMSPKNKTAPFQAFFASFESCNVKDPLTVEFKAKTLHFKNLEKLTELLILPKHFYSTGDFNKAFGSKMLGSGPYMLEEADQGKRLVLKRNASFWGAALPQNVGRYNFDKIIMKAVPDYDVQFEQFKRGDIDYFYFLVSKMWATQTDGPLFQKHYVEKIKAENQLPYGTQGIAWNLRKPLFADKRVRLAMSHLMNREKYIKELFFNNYVPTAGIAHTRSDWHSPNNKPVPYDPKKAKELLKEAGWDKLGSDGVLVKDGQKFEFEIISDNPMSSRYLTVFKEDLKSMGIVMNIRTVDWTTHLKLVDDWKFDASEVNRSREIHPSDFAVMWGSLEADKKGSANLTGYKNPEVDKLAQQIDETFDEAKRKPLVHKLDEIIAADQPMSFAWEPTFIRLAHWNRFGFPGKGYFSYSYWRSAYQYWWYDGAKAEKLKKAQASGQAF